MDFETLLYNVEDRVATITLNRPDKLNALNLAMVSELGQAVDALAADEEVRGIIFVGAGDKAFVAGADISELVERKTHITLAKQHGAGERKPRTQLQVKPLLCFEIGWSLTEPARQGLHLGEVVMHQSSIGGDRLEEPVNAPGSTWMAGHGTVEQAQSSLPG